jgi:hypothetical protein
MAGPSAHRWINPSGSGRIRNLSRTPSGELETCPAWVPAMDTVQRSARIALKTMGVHGFDHIANWVAKVRNVSGLGSQIAPYSFQLGAKPAKLS